MTGTEQGKIVANVRSKARLAPKPGQHGTHHEIELWPATRALVDLWERPDSGKLLRFAAHALGRVRNVLGVLVVEPE